MTGAAAQKRYAASKKGRVTQHKYNHSKKGLARSDRYNAVGGYLTRRQKALEAERERICAALEDNRKEQQAWLTNS